MATATKRAPRPPQPKFNDLVSELAAADMKARAISGDAAQARAERQVAAVSSIRAAWFEKIDPNDVRTALLDGGVLKGTVSKIVTVVTALNDKVISIGDVKSLNGAYTSVKMLHKIAAGYASTAAPGTPYSTAAPAIVATTPDEAIKVLVESIKSVTDPDEAFKLGGEWITRVTNGITDALKAREGHDE